MSPRSEPGAEACRASAVSHESEEPRARGASVEEQKTAVPTRVKEATLAFLCTNPNSVGDLQLSDPLFPLTQMLIFSKTLWQAPAQADMFHHPSGHP